MEKRDKEKSKKMLFLKNFYFLSQFPKNLAENIFWKGYIPSSGSLHN